METSNIKEFIEKDGTLINSKMAPNLNRMAMSKQTTDQHVASSRQGMVWMNYRRFYGEVDETLPFTKEADKWEKNPEAFFKFLKSKNKQKDFNKYFVKKDKKIETTDTVKVLKETGRKKMRSLIEDLVTKRRENNDLVKKKLDDKPTISNLRERETALLKEIDKMVDKIKETFVDEEERDTIVDYIIQTIA